MQPQLAESDLFFLRGLGPAQPSLNEFNPLFLRNRFSLLASGLFGTHETYGDEVVQSGIWNQFSYSLGQFHYETDDEPWKVEDRGEKPAIALKGR